METNKGGQKEKDMKTETAETNLVNCSVINTSSNEAER